MVVCSPTLSLEFLHESLTHKSSNKSCLARSTISFHSCGEQTIQIFGFRLFSWLDESCVQRVQFGEAVVPGIYYGWGDTLGNCLQHLCLSVTVGECRIESPFCPRCPISVCSIVLSHLIHAVAWPTACLLSCHPLLPSFSNQGKGFPPKKRKTVKKKISFYHLFLMCMTHRLKLSIVLK